MDRRVIKTKNAIKETFFKLLGEKNLNQITVAEVSRRADIGRGTFYLHYSDVFDLYNSIEHEIYVDIERFIDDAHPSTNPDNLHALVNNAIQYLVEKRDRLILLTKPENNGNIRDKLKQLLSEKASKRTDAAESAFFASGVIGIVEEWLTNGLQVSQTQLSAMLHKILIKFNEVCGNDTFDKPTSTTIYAAETRTAGQT